jgi:hypothetical protein
VSKLIRPGWMPRPALDLRYRHFERVKHGIRCIGTWWSESEFRSQPCLVLLSASAPIDNRVAQPIIIPLSDLWVYIPDGDGGDPGQAMLTITSWLSEGLLPGSPYRMRDIIDVLDAINDCARDVIHMPPRPKGDQEAHVGTGRKTNLSTGKTDEFEVTTDV